MKKIAWKKLIILVIISSMIPNIGKSLHNFDNSRQNYPLGLSNSDSWSKILTEGGRIYSPYCELVNGSLYIIGRLNSDDNSEKIIYVSKFNTSGIKEWEYTTTVDDFYFMSYVFDNEINMFLLIEYDDSDKISLIKLNSSGALLFSKEFSLGRNNRQLSLVLSENNSLLIVGQYSPQLYHPRLFIMKYNNTGQLLWNTSFIIDTYYRYPSILKDPGNYMYLHFRNNSIYTIAKINSSGAIEWQMETGDIIQKLMVDSNDNLFIVGAKNFSTGYILKLNSNGDQIKEILTENFDAEIVGIWHLNDSFVFKGYSMSMLCFDLNLDLKWNFSLSEYITYHFYLRSFLAKDSQDNVYILQNNELGNINLVKISSTGEFLSRIIWGGYYDEEPRSLVIDLDDNIYFICDCEYYNIWNNLYEYTVLVKNPINGGTPPEINMDLEIHDYFLFSVVGIACIISPIALLSILRRNKKRTS